MGPDRAGHRALPHTADIRVEAWAPTREACIAEAARAVVESFADLGSARSGEVRRRTLVARTDEDLLVATLDELIFLLDTTGEIPVDLELHPTSDGAEAVFAMALPGDVAQVGSVPKGVSLNDLHLAEAPEGWRCEVTLDV